MTNRTFRYHAATKELVENKVYPFTKGGFASMIKEIDPVRLNATAMNLPDEDDGKEFVEGVDFDIKYEYEVKYFTDRWEDLQTLSWFFCLPSDIEFNEHANNVADGLGMDDDCKFEVKGHKILAIPIQKQESEDELWGEMLKMTLPISLDAAQNKVKNPKQHLIDHLKKHFTIKRK